MDTTIRSRFEFKYLIPQAMADSVRRFIAPFAHLDQYAAQTPNGRYTISSLYLDSPDLQLHRGTVEGHKNRFKLRIRAYSDDPADPVFFEVKRRTSDAILKKRFRVNRIHAAEFLAGRIPAAAEKFEEFSHLVRQCDARPVIRIRYQREAHESRDADPVRITFDTDLTHVVTPDGDISQNGPGWSSTPLDGTILEIKFTDRFPSWVAEMVGHFELQRRSIPKYIMSLDHAMETGAYHPGLAPLRPL